MRELGIIVSRYGNIVVAWPTDRLANVLTELRVERNRKAIVQQHVEFNAVCEHATGLIRSLQGIAKEFHEGRGDPTGIPALINATRETHGYLDQVLTFLTEIQRVNS